MLDIIKENLVFILDSIDIISDRIQKLKNADDLVTSADGVTILDSLAMRLQSIGETVKQIEKRDRALLQKYPDTDWQQIIRMRDLISHHYEDIDHEIVYNLCNTHLPQLRSTIKKIITDLNKK
ncbi:MAG: DUF86 domain-containing protein [Ignavibacteria bacterium]|nr:DUF86 domain-containing protein [Ignavibacteria bacterium]